ncbi:chromosomal replication initiator protein DnaA [Desulfurobacterium atlanticum]|uniref:chromosomal replication initiator protein DnaA n=1 Tax=Desulfurobacterium atlanticum TaxID=240169 RepID=UPI000B77F528|nr:chromosomal replication initiator protein DnaA [Desulfurobacterium atlanticum]
MKAVWDKCLNELKKSIKPHEYKTWIKDLEFISVSGNRLTLKAKDNITKEFVEKRYLPLIQNVVGKNFGKPLKISIVLQEKASKGVMLELNLSTKKAPKIESNLNPKYTFENFIVGSSNQFAHAAAIAVAENPGKAYNPLFIYGGVGLGKTHLMQAIGNFVKEHFPSKTVVYVTTESFMNDLIDSLRNDRMTQFREKYRTVDILLIDDIQFISGKDRTQIEFFHTFNALYDSGKQVVLTSDRPPKDIPMLTERLRSRFEWGLIADIQPPDFETRIAILRRKAEDEGIEVSDEVLKLIASRIKSNIRQLEGTLLKLKAKAQLEGKPLDAELVRTTLSIEPGNSTSVSESFSETLPVDEIKKAVSQIMNVKIEDLDGNSRKKQIALARQIAMYLCKKLGNYSYPKIAAAFNRSDHTTAMHAYNRIKELREKDAQIQSLLYEIEGVLTRSVDSAL